MTMMEQKQEIIDDLKVCVEYTPDMEADMICLTGRYQKEVSRRPELRETMKRLLNEEPYDNPHASYYFYGASEVAELDAILTAFILQMPYEANKRNFFREVINRVNYLHLKCREELIDEWRAPRLEQLLLQVATAQVLCDAPELLAEEKLWSLPNEHQHGYEM